MVDTVVVVDFVISLWVGYNPTTSHNNERKVITTSHKRTEDVHVMERIDNDLLFPFLDPNVDIEDDLDLHVLVKFQGMVPSNGTKVSLASNETLVRWFKRMTSENEKGIDRK